MKKDKEVFLYKETYKKPYQRYLKAFLPSKLDFVTVKHTVEEIQLMGAGIVSRGDQKLEYQDLRVYLKLED